MDENEKKNVQGKNWFRTYDDFEAWINLEQDPRKRTIIKIQYAILFRRWDKVKELFDDSSLIDIKNIKTTEALVPVWDENNISWENYSKCIGEQECTITIGMLLRYNEDKITAYSEKEECEKEDTLWNRVKEIVSKDVFPVFTYDEKITADGKSIFELFFSYNAPLLGVKKLEAQILPSRQVWKNLCSLVMNEVGTGKTISALYAIARTIEEVTVEGREAKILIVCPANLRVKWEEDIRDNLGRYCYKLNRGEQKETIFQGDWKKAYFHNNEQCIFLVDNIVSGKNDVKNYIWNWSQNVPNVPWDLIVIDEVHLCPYNYSNLRGRRTMLLTATPVVRYMDRNIWGEITTNRLWEHYRTIMKNITGVTLDNKEINPLHNVNPSEEDIFTNYFREDMETEVTEREIIFKTAKRMENYITAVKRIEEKTNWLVADHYAQDDNYLAEQYFSMFNENIDCDYNDKQEKLKEIIFEDLPMENQNPAVIVFCEHEKVAKRIFDSLKNTEGCIVALKTGTVEMINREQTGNIVSTLHQYIRKSDRTVVLIATGKTGGTGLNMGDFDAVVHYEIPYTSIALEQRFGRIDRMSGGKIGSKKMFFILDEDEGEGSGRDTVRNRLFRFCVTKLDITCRFLPVRNTVLFTPIVAKYFKNLWKSELEGMKLFADRTFDATMYWEFRTKYKETREDVEKIWRKWKGEKSKEESSSLEEWKYYIEPNPLNDEELKVKIINLKEMKTDFDKIDGAIKELRKFIAENKPKVDLLYESRTDSEDDIFVYNYVNDGDDSDREEEKNLGDTLHEAYSAKENEKINDFESINYQEQYDEIHKKVMNINPDKFKGRLANGVFYYTKDKQLVVDDVLSLRHRVGR